MKISEAEQPHNCCNEENVGIYVQHKGILTLGLNWSEQLKLWGIRKQKKIIFIRGRGSLNLVGLKVGTLTTL